jgi:hypothetical protein
MQGAQDWTGDTCFSKNEKSKIEHKATETEQKQVCESTKTCHQG